MNFNLDSWVVKFAIVLSLVAAREFVRLLSPKEAVGVVRDDNSKWLIETIDSAAIAIGLVLFIIQPFLLQAFYIPSGSMEDTLRINDRLLVSKLVYRMHPPQFQDVVVFKAPEAALLGQTLDPGETDFIKRCIGTPGDTIYVINRQYFRRAKGESTFSKLSEPYVKWSPPGRAPIYSYDMKIIDGVVYSREYDQQNATGLWKVNGREATDQERISKAKPGAVPESKFLMFGDHRNNSNDGHAWGFVSPEQIRGKAIFVFWPPTRLGLVDRMSFHPRPPQDDATAGEAPLLTR